MKKIHLIAAKILRILFVIAGFHFLTMGCMGLWLMFSFIPPEQAPSWFISQFAASLVEVIFIGAITLFINATLPD